MEISVYGIIGFLGFEALKIYKKLDSHEPIVYNKQYFLYFTILILLSVFSGVLAHAFASDNITEAIFVGFSVPTNIKVIFNKMPAKEKSNDSTNVEDIDELKPKNIIYYLKYVYLVFLKF
jgi:hypothetical protein